MHNSRLGRRIRLGLVLLALLAACRPATQPPTSRPAITPTLVVIPATMRPSAAAPATATARPDVFRVQVDLTRSRHAISPLIYGLSGGTPETMAELRPTLISWGGNASSRYNWEHGHAWNAGSDWFFRNGNYGYIGDSASDDFIELAMAHEAEVRLTVPTLGWVAKNDDNAICSFPLPSGDCGDAGGASCENPTTIANPRQANIASDEASIAAWMQHLLIEQGYDVRFVALDNEPELWGFTHYDVHPGCTTYDEILTKYLSYATAIRAIAPEVELVGPNTCCWHYYWNSAAGASDQALHGGSTFLPWFLDSVRQHDEVSGVRTLDVLDVHYYPEGLYNERTDEGTAAHRLRSTRSLWDPTYVDESWVDTPVTLIPRLQRLVEDHYPGTRVGLSEWNWGADETINGALAIADVLGILGREQLYYAAYWREPPAGSPGYFAFKIYMNYDDQGSQFGDESVWSQTDNVDIVSTYAALDSASGALHVMLVHKQPNHALTIALDLSGFAPEGPVALYRLTEAVTGLETATLAWDTRQPLIELPAYSVTHLIFTPGQPVS